MSDQYPGAHRMADVPLAELFPELTPDERRRITAAADAVDALRPATDVRRIWQWFPAGRSFLTEVFLDPNRDVELQIEVGPVADGRLACHTQVQVGCACERDHGGHVADPVSTVVGDGRSLADAFEQGVARLRAAAAASADPGHWRCRAGVA
ncbi:MULTISPECIES: hypothetical protein [Kitasatospora]|uniref:Uncharacterized protein n=1 Tax=Kitasatospora setae (strain ATCC 33774 / DSM 43861 / JCM 3304 / KCC A-0304 / NBRC 14216 / KM-6054) TaxID=452652 RepID=E4NJE4_KITSK|nr:MULTISPECIES: hypothetical protein [Kitasatospora]BAJ33092.1 hypothetical protein KSE_73370 [Kitasatospora setae KM-6054]